MHVYSINIRIKQSEVVTMQPVITVEFSAKAGDCEFKEENVAFHNSEELFSFIAPGVAAILSLMKLMKFRWYFFNPNTPTQKIRLRTK